MKFEGDCLRVSSKSQKDSGVLDLETEPLIAESTSDALSVSFPMVVSSITDVARVDTPDMSAEVSPLTARVLSSIARVDTPDMLTESSPLMLLSVVKLFTETPDVSDDSVPTSVEMVMFDDSDPSDIALFAG